MYASITPQFKDVFLAILMHVLGAWAGPMKTEKSVSDLRGASVFGLVLAMGLSD